MWALPCGRTKSAGANAKRGKPRLYVEQEYVAELKIGQGRLVAAA
jgi:hypothetical protein